jgi:hypothetical protein
MPLPALGQVRGVSGLTQWVTQRLGGSGAGSPVVLLPDGYLLAMCPPVDRIHRGAHRQYSRSTQGERRRDEWATSFPTIRVCIDTREHLGMSFICKLRNISE